MKYQIFIPCVPPKATHQGSAMILRRRDGGGVGGGEGEEKLA